MKNRSRWALGLVICGLSVALLLAARWPVERDLEQFEIPAQAFVQSSGAAGRAFATDPDGNVLLPSQYRLTLDAPAVLRRDGEQSLRLAIQSTGPTNAASPFTGWQASVEASLSYPLVDVHPCGSIYQRLETDRPATFEWHLGSAGTLDQTGTLAVYLLFTPPQDGDPVRVIALARPLDFAVANPLGVPERFLLIAGCAGLLAGGWILFPVAGWWLIRTWRGIRTTVDNSDK